MAKKYDVAVLGAGPGGYVAAIRAAQNGLSVVCIESRKELGGTCLNVGCIPSKALLHSSEMYAHLVHKGKEHGIKTSKVDFDFKQMMKRKSGVVEGFVTGINGLFKKNKVDRVEGRGVLTSATTIEVTNGKKKETVEAANIILATGSEPFELPFLPFDEKFIISSTGALSLPKVPKKMLVVGAGVIGLELGSVYARLGTEVIVVELLENACPMMDKDVSDSMVKLLKAEGMKFHFNTEVTRGKVKDDQVSLIVTDKKDEQTTLINADAVLVSIGRRPVTKDLGLEALGINVGKGGFIEVDGNFRTAVPNVFAIGDIIDGPMLAHKASEEGVAVADLLVGKAPHVNYLAIPNVVYTDPEIATVGLTEQEAKEMGLKVKKAKFPFKANSRARCIGEDEGFVKVIADAGTGRIVGIHIVGSKASELIAAGVVAIEKGMTAQELGASPLAHPTLSESLKEASMGVFEKPIHM